MYNTLMRMWKQGKLTEAQIDRAVELGWITEQQAETIKNTPKY